MHAQQLAWGPHRCQAKVYHLWMHFHMSERGNLVCAQLGPCMAHAQPAVQVVQRYSSRVALICLLMAMGPNLHAVLAVQQQVLQLDVPMDALRAQTSVRWICAGISA